MTGRTLVLRTPVMPVGADEASSVIAAWATDGIGRVLCAAKVRMVMEAWNDASFAAGLARADLTVCDGRPLVWACRLQGVRYARQTRGMEFMFEICALAARRGLTVGLYGAEPSVSDAVRRRLLESHPGLKVVYCCSPPFGQLTGTEDKAVMEGLSDAAVQMLFVSLGCPKPYQLSTTHVRSGASRYGNPNFAFAASRVTLRS